MMLAHGNYSIVVCDHNIIIRLTGAFNDEGIKAVTKAAKEVIATFEQKMFAILINFSEFEGGTLESYEEANKFNEWLYSRQKVMATALVSSSNVVMDIALKFVPAQAKFNVEYFDNENSALDWLATKSD